MTDTTALPTSTTTASSIAQRLRYLAGRIHQLGPGPLYQLMAELSGSSTAMERFEVYGALDGALIRAFGGDKLPSHLWRVK